MRGAARHRAVARELSISRDYDATLAQAMMVAARVRVNVSGLPVEMVMAQDRHMSDMGASGVPIGAETIADYRARIAHQQAEAARRRQEELEEQSSTLKTPDTPIRIWERLHEVGLPRDPSHRLVDIIAANTGLTVEEVRDEQRLRATVTTATATRTE